MKTIVITKKTGNTPLNNIWMGEFCIGKRCIEHFNRCYIAFRTNAEAKKYIEVALNDLKNWIEVDIPEQSKQWDKSQVDEFLCNSKSHYNEIKKAINDLVIKVLTH